MTSARWLEETHSQHFELCRHFFGRFFDSDLAAPGQWKVVAAGAFGLIASLAVLLVPAYYHKYAALSEMDTPAVFHAAALADHLFFIVFSMTLAGMLTALQWQSLFPDLRDYLALASLPVRARHIFIAKFAALVLFAAVFILAINLLPAVSLPAVMAGRYQPNGLARFVGLMASTCLAGLFTFFSLVALQGLLLNILPPRIFPRFAQTLQGALFLLLIGCLPLVLTIPSQTRLAADPPGWLVGSPLYWFLALDQSILGSGAAVPGSPSNALTGTGVAIAAALLTYFWSYRFHRIRVLETAVAPDAGFSLIRRTYDWLAYKVMPDPSEQGVFFFTGATLARSTRHRMVLTVFVAAAGALIVESFLSLLLSRRADAWSVEGFALRHAAIATPLALSLFSLSGLRYLFRLPVELRANWIFRIDEGGAQRTYQSAMDHFMRWWGAFPIALVTIPLEIAVFGTGVGVGAALLCLLIALLLIEILLTQFPRVPFTSAYFPAKQPLVQTVLTSGIYVVLYVSILGTITVRSLAKWQYFLMESGLLLAIWAKVRRERMSTFLVSRIEFDDLPEPDVCTLSIERD